MRYTETLLRQEYKSLMKLLGLIDSWTDQLTEFRNGTTLIHPYREKMQTFRFKINLQENLVQEGFKGYVDSQTGDQLSVAQIQEKFTELLIDGLDISSFLRRKLAKKRFGFSTKNHYKIEKNNTWITDLSEFFSVSNFELQVSCHLETEEIRVPESFQQKLNKTMFNFEYVPNRFLIQMYKETKPAQSSTAGQPLRQIVEPLIGRRSTDTSTTGEASSAEQPSMALPSPEVFGDAVSQAAQHLYTHMMAYLATGFVGQQALARAESQVEQRIPRTERQVEQRIPRAERQIEQPIPAEDVQSDTTEQAESIAEEPSFREGAQFGALAQVEELGPQRNVYISANTLKKFVKKCGEVSIGLRYKVKFKGHRIQIGPQLTFPGLDTFGLQMMICVQPDEMKHKSTTYSSISANVEIKHKFFATSLETDIHKNMGITSEVKLPLKNNTSLNIGYSPKNSIKSSYLCVEQKFGTSVVGKYSLGTERLLEYKTHCLHPVRKSDTLTPVIGVPTPPVHPLEYQSCFTIISWALIGVARLLHFFIMVVRSFKKLKTEEKARNQKILLEYETLEMWQRIELQPENLKKRKK